MGSTAIINTSTPIPPIQWVKDRQKRLALESPSILFRMEAPVVVRPDMVSKNASTYDGISPESTNGSAPKADMTSHTSVTVTNPSRA